MRGTLLLALVGLVGCAEDAPRPAIEDAHIVVSWSSGTSRFVSITIPEIPCTGTEDDLLGESGVTCTSEPWTAFVDGTQLEVRQIQCEAAHQGWFGPVDKYCTGAGSTFTIPESGDPDVEIVIQTGDDKVPFTLHGVRRTHAFVEESHGTLSPQKYGIVRVDDIELSGSSFAADFTLAGTTRRGTAHVLTSDTGKLSLEPPFAAAPGVYQIRIQALTRDDGVGIAVPVIGTLTIE